MKTAFGSLSFSKCFVKYCMRFQEMVPWKYHLQEALSWKYQGLSGLPNRTVVINQDCDSSMTVIIGITPGVHLGSNTRSNYCLFIIVNKNVIYMNFLESFFCWFKHFFVKKRTREKPAGAFIDTPYKPHLYTMESWHSSYVTFCVSVLQCLHICYEDQIKEFPYDITARTHGF